MKNVTHFYLEDGSPTLMTQTYQTYPIYLATLLNQNVPKGYT